MYHGTINADFLQAKKLFFLADKYIQDDLKDKCVNVLIHHLTPKTICEMFDFACEHNLVLLRSWCLQQFSPYQMDWSNLAKFIKCLDSQKNPEDEKETKELMEKAVDRILKDFAEIEYSVENQAIAKVFENFLIKNISKENIYKFTNKFTSHFLRKRNEKEIIVTNVGDAVLNFVFTNYQSFEEKDLVQEFGNTFFSYLKQYKTQRESTLAQDESKGSEGNEKATNE